MRISEGDPAHRRKRPAAEKTMRPMKDASMVCLSVGVPVEPSEKSDNAAICKQSCQHTIAATKGLRHEPEGLSYTLRR